ncbi:MAG: GNAT family protein [Corynebacterium sp.]|nr:GNAT family protein [Corynebacterium sp.]
MTFRTNEFDQPIGEPISNWQPALRPAKVTLEGNFCSLVPLSMEHSAELFAAYTSSPDPTPQHHIANSNIWTYLRQGPFASLTEYETWVHGAITSQDAITYSVINTETSKPVGTLSLMRIDTANGVIEVGNVVFSPLMQGTALSTEAQFLLMQYVFDQLNYRRYEWKCDSLNAPSMRAAERLGFTYEGTFRNAVVYKGRNRDTAWYSITDTEWEHLRPAFQQWLSTSNFIDGKQIRRLQDLR